MRAWQALVVSIGAGASSAFLLLFSMADGGASAHATLMSGAVAGAVTVVLVLWFGWAHWWVAQTRARWRW